MGGASIKQGRAALEENLDSCPDQRPRTLSTHLEVGWSPDSLLFRALLAKAPPASVAVPAPNPARS